MLNKILSLFKKQSSPASLTVDQNGAPCSNELKVAVSIMLLEASGTDDDYAPEEVKAAYQLLEKYFLISHEQAEAVLEQADTIRGEKEKLNEYVKKLNNEFSSQQRQIVFLMIWKILTADNKVTKEEHRIANQYRTRLQLTEEQAEQAKRL